MYSELATIYSDLPSGAESLKAGQSGAESLKTGQSGAESRTDIPSGSESLGGSDQAHSSNGAPTLTETERIVCNSETQSGEQASSSVLGTSHKRKNKRNVKNTTRQEVKQTSNKPVTSAKSDLLGGSKVNGISRIEPKEQLLSDLCVSGDLEEVVRMLEEDREEVSGGSGSEQDYVALLTRLLHVVSAHGHAPLVTALLELGAQPTVK